MLRYILFCWDMLSEKYNSGNVECVKGRATKFLKV